ncbi:glycolate oxidase iron-sulfur subunit, partial [Amaricoccus sp. HAR-UPW-R2A-40]
MAEVRGAGLDAIVVNTSGCGTAQSHAAAGPIVRAWMAEVRGAGLDAIVVNTSG